RWICSSSPAETVKVGPLPQGLARSHHRACNGKPRTPIAGRFPNRTETIVRKTVASLTAAAAIAGTLMSARAEQVGKIGVDWFGNDIKIEAVSDPKVEGVTCHLAYFDRGVIDRLQKGNWFEDPS